MSDMLLKAITLATRAHEGQVRKYTNEPYITHPFAVAGLVASVWGSENMIIASILHDVVEDTDIGIKTMEGIFGSEIASYVSDLTYVSTLEDGSRAERRELDRAHTSMASANAKTIKLADLIDNTKSIVALDPKFAAIYMPEKRELLKVLTEGNPTLWSIANKTVENYFKGCK